MRSVCGVRIASLLARRRAPAPQADLHLVRKVLPSHHLIELGHRRPERVALGVEIREIPDDGPQYHSPPDRTEAHEHCSCHLLWHVARGSGDVAVADRGDGHDRPIDGGGVLVPSTVAHDET